MAKETKSRKMTFMIRPSVAEAANKIVYAKRESLNNLINNMLEDYVNANREYVTEYDDFCARINSKVAVKNE